MSSDDLLQLLNSALTARFEFEEDAELQDEQSDSKIVTLLCVQ